MTTLMLVPLVGGFMDPEWLLATFGSLFLIISAVMIFAECAIFPVLPGDSLLFAIGMFVAQRDGLRVGGLGELATLATACLGFFVVAILGNIVGYFVGRSVAPWLFREREGVIGRIFAPDRLVATQRFFERYGAKALVLGRFVPFVRTFVTMVAGATGMTFRHFIGWTALGALIWAPAIIVLGYFLGTIPIIRNNLEVALVAIVVISTIPMVIEYLRERRRAQALGS